MGTLKNAQLARSPEEQLAIRLKQGRAIYSVSMKIVDGNGRTLPNDDQAVGDLLVQVPWIVDRYFKQEGESPLVDGWFPTGDVARIDADGFMQITDRSKDLIKSGKTVAPAARNRVHLGIAKKCRAVLWQAKTGSILRGGRHVANATAASARKPQGLGNRSAHVSVGELA